MNTLETTVAAISFSASGIMTVIMHTKETIRLFEHEGHRFRQFVFGNEFGAPVDNHEFALMERYEDMDVRRMRHPNRIEKIDRNFSWIGASTKANKCHRRGINARARRSKQIN